MSLEAKERKKGYVNLSGRNDEDPTITVMMEIGEKGTDSRAI